MLHQGGGEASSDTADLRLKRVPGRTGNHGTGRR